MWDESLWDEGLWDELALPPASTPLLVWEKCPFCGESTDTERIGKPFYTTTDNEGKLHVHGSTLKKCNFCGKTWHSELPTMKEAFGDDQENDTAF